MYRMHCVEVLWRIYWYWVIPMTTLDPKLSKLRNKELSFWCYCAGNKIISGIRTYGIYVLTRWFTMLYSIETKQDEPVYADTLEIIWHPLTRGRIWQMWYNQFLEDGGNVIDTMQCIWLDLQSMWVADKTEIERMQQPKRPELRELLVQFSNYLS